MLFLKVLKSDRVRSARESGGLAMGSRGSARGSGGIARGSEALARKSGGVAIGFGGPARGSGVSGDAGEFFSTTKLVSLLKL